jgi:tRNA A37 threonylcarbamoyladenosine biosynthesis protein TsaE
MTLTQTQQSIFNEIIETIEESLGLGQKFIGSLTGPAGTGKTVMTSLIIKSLLEKYPSKLLKITTPTHKSLRVINNFIDAGIKKHRNFSSSTIHAYLKLKMQKIEDKIVFIEDFDDGKIDKTKILIIDESSMVSKSLFNHIKKKASVSGIDIVLFVGDKMQLLPVDGEYNPVYEEITQYELTEVVRQAWDNPVLKKATEIRECIATKNFDMNVLSFAEFKDSNSGVMTYSDMKIWLKSYLENKRDIVLSAFTNTSVNEYNSFVRSYKNQSLSLPKLIDNEEVVLQEAYEYNGIFVSNGDTLTVYSPMQEYHNILKLNYWSFSPKEDGDGLIIKVLDNDSLGEYNALLDKISKRAKQLKFESKHKEAKDMWDKYWEVKSLFVDIKYNFAHTIHKLQGSTYDDVYLNLKETIENSTDLENLFRLVYVALTRARHDVYLLV